MKRTYLIMILAMVAGTAAAQMPAAATNKAKGAAAEMNKNTVKTNAALPAASTAKPPAQANVVTKSPVPAAQHQAPSVAKVDKPAKPAAKKVATPVPAAPKPEAVAAKSNAEPEMVTKKRDPFVSPIVTKVGGPTNCAGGKKCLVVDQVGLRGVVRSQTGMIAVVVNAANKAYFMRENDPVYNGFVVKITPDSIVFRETVTDRLGKQGTREVVKKVNAPVV